MLLQEIFLANTTCYSKTHTENGPESVRKLEDKRITLVTFVSLIYANNICPQTSSYVLAESSDFGV